MEINSALDAGLQGMQNSQQKIEQAADGIAKAGRVEPAEPKGPNEVAKGRPPEMPEQLVEQLVELREQELAFEASAEVVRTADKMLSKFIDQMV